MTAVDWIAILIVVFAALGGATQGFVWSGLSLAGLLVGAVVGGRLAPVLLSGGSKSPYAPVLALAGAVTLAVSFEVVGSSLGAAVRSREAPTVRQLDSAAGVLVGAVVGLMVVWVLGAMALQLPGQTNLRRAAQRSAVLRRLNSIVPPRTLLPGLGARPLRLVGPRPGTSVALVGYPQNGPLDAVPGRIGSTRAVLSQDAYGRGPVERTVTSLSGNVRHGDSGGPAVDASGAVETTVFAARVNGSGGYGVPASLVRRALARAQGLVSTGPCT